MDLWDKAVIALVAAVVLTAVGAMIYIVWLNIAHPCVRYEPGTCVGQRCSMFNTKGGCSVYTSYTYACDKCVEREP